MMPANAAASLSCLTRLLLLQKKELVDKVKAALPPLVKVPVVKVQAPAPSQSVAVSGAPVTVSGVPVVEVSPHHCLT